VIGEAAVETDKDKTLKAYQIMIEHCMAKKNRKKISSLLAQTK